MTKKKVHLICNAHLDPIWQWDWQEGASAAISTFQSAVNLAEEYDYIFCHNEVTLYKYIEEYAPHLFRKIQQLVKQGKWHIMGGWYLQPDCTMPSGESFVRQILTGHRYFQEKFGVTPTTVINFDPFGHTRGLVQIIKKCGQNSYMNMRPYRSEMPLDDDQFWWEGFDGSRIKVNRTTAYSSHLGESVKKIKEDIEAQPQPVISSLWGVGNHGGGPSRIDLQQISEFIKEAQKEGIEVVHSTPEDFFREITPTQVYKKSMYLCMPGCYVSMSKLKRLHVELENQLYFSEKICSVATMNGLMEYPHEKFDTITEDLLNSEFHDVLPGSSVQSGEENGIKLLHHGLLDVEKLTTRAFFALATAQKPAQEGDYPIFVFNPHPYEFDTDVECEFTLADQNWNGDIESHISVLDDAGKTLTSQTIKEESNLTLDWRKRVVFPARLKPMSLTRFSLRAEMDKPRTKAEEAFQYVDAHKVVEIDRKTGLLKRFCVDGVEYIHDAFCPVMFDDNADPWGMGAHQLTHLGENPQPFAVPGAPSGIFGGLKGVKTIENGPVFLAVEALFQKDDCKVQVVYRIYKERPYADVNVTVFWQAVHKLLRLAIPMSTSGKLVGQTAFGKDDLFNDGRENVSQRFIAVEQGDKALAVFNNGTYGSMFENNTLYLSLLRSAAYCAHPIEDRPLIPEDRYIKHIDQCEHNYSFRIAVADPEALERMATEFNQRPFVQNVFPVISEYDPEGFKKTLIVSNPDVTLVTMKQARVGEYFILRLMNNSEREAKTLLTIGDASTALSFGKFEVKTVRFDGTFTECEMLEI